MWGSEGTIPVIPTVSVNPFPTPTKLSKPRIDEIHLYHRERLVGADNLTDVFTIPCTSKTKSSHSSVSSEYILSEETIVEYDNDKAATGGDEPEPNTSVSRESSRIAPNSFPERRTTHALTELRVSSTLEKGIITNRLYDQQ